MPCFDTVCQKPNYYVLRSNWMEHTGMERLVKCHNNLIIIILHMHTPLTQEKFLYRGVESVFSEGSILLISQNKAKPQKSSGLTSLCKKNASSNDDMTKQQ